MGKKLELEYDLCLLPLYIDCMKNAAEILYASLFFCKACAHAVFAPYICSPVRLSAAACYYAAALNKHQE